MSVFIVNVAQARIDILPQKIVIGERDRSSELTVLNLSNTTGTFRIELVSFKQNEFGVYEALEAPLNENFNPESIVRLSPRQFTIEPGGRQKVRVSLRKPADLANGEYRFHIKAIRLLQDEELQSEDPEAVSIVANIGVTIPAVVRHGKVSSDAILKNIQLVGPSQTKNNKPELRLEIERSGDASTLGAIEVFWEQGGKSEQIGRIKNMNLFTDINRRYVGIPLSMMPSGEGKIHVRYIDDTNKRNVFDEQWISSQ